MALKRYTNQELKVILKDIFFNYMIEDNHVQEVYNDYMDFINTCKQRIELYNQGIARATKPEQVQSFKIGISFLRKSIDNLNTNMQKQRELYAKTQKVDFARTHVRIPLNKKINSFYDDLYLEVLFYDDICTPQGKINRYLNLTSKEEQFRFFANNIEITNMTLVYVVNNREQAFIDVWNSEFNGSDIRKKDVYATLLSKKYSDFENLTLADISAIRNNDLKQYLQSKIDLDKENLSLLASVTIRGDIYKILKSPYDNELYIRYVCRSTGRVYHNRLNLDNLQISEKFVSKDYDSYAKAWWELNTLGGNVEGKPVIRC